MLDVECMRGPLILSSNVTISSCFVIPVSHFEECLSLYEVCLLA